MGAVGNRIAHRYPRAVPTYADFLARTRAAIREVTPAEALGRRRTCSTSASPTSSPRACAPGRARDPARRPREPRRGGGAGSRGAGGPVLRRRQRARCSPPGRWPSSATPTCARSPAASRRGRRPGCRSARGDGELSAAQRARYARHLMLPEVGVAGQQQAAGGAGRGDRRRRAGLAGGDVPGGGGRRHADDHRRRRGRRVEPAAPDRCTPPSGSASPRSTAPARTIGALNPDVAVVRSPRCGSTSGNALALLAGHDVIVDGSDNFATRYLVNDVALRLGIRWSTRRSGASRASSRCSAAGGRLAIAACIRRRRRPARRRAAPRPACSACCPA
jgi:hypothetical protein